MDENDKGNRCVEQDGPSTEKKISRRNFIATSLGAGAAVLGAGVAIDQVLMGEKNSRNSDSGQSRNSSSSSVRVMPASTYAQSILLGVCPSNLVSLCEEANVYESAGLSSPEALAITGCYEPDNADSFIEYASSLNPDLILDVGHYDNARASDIEDLRNKTSLHCEVLSFNDYNLKLIVEGIAELVDIELPDEVLDPVEKISYLVRSAAIEKNLQVSVCLAGHDDGMYAYGSESKCGHVVSRMAAYLDLSRSAGYAPSFDAAELSFEDFSESRVAMPDVVLLVNGDAARDYVDEKELGYWRILEPGRLGYVFPVLVGGYLWFDEISQFAKDFVAGAWLSLFFSSCYYYDNLFDFSQVVVDFYRCFYGTELFEDAYASKCRSLIESKIPLDRDTIAQAQSEFEKEQKQASEAISDALDDEANRVYSYDELHERYQALCEGFGKEYSDEGFEEYLSACKEEGIYRG